MYNQICREEGGGNNHEEKNEDTKEEGIEIGTRCLIRKRNSRIAPAPISGFITLPPELCLLIMEYSVASIRDLFFLGFICQPLRSVGMMSPLWRKFHHPPGPAATTALVTGDIESNLSIHEIRGIILLEYKSQYERKRKLHLQFDLVNDLFAIYLFLCLSSLICFGNYSTISSPLFQNIGCICLYVGLFLFTIIFHYAQDSHHSRLLITSLNFFFLLTIVLLHWKYLSPHSLQWIEVISPLWLLFLNIPLWILTHRKYSSCNKFKFLFRYFFFFTPPFVALYLYCRCLDQNSEIPRGIICLILPPKGMIDYLSLIQLFATVDQLSQGEGSTVSHFFYLILVLLGATSTQFFLFRVIDYCPSSFFIFFSLACFGGVLFLNPKLEWKRANDLNVFRWLSD
jgi:hypothetical protein